MDGLQKTGEVPFEGYPCIEGCRDLQSLSWTVVFPKGRTLLPYSLRQTPGTPGTRVL